MIYNEIYIDKALTDIHKIEVSNKQVLRPNWI